MLNINYTLDAVLNINYTLDAVLNINYTLDAVLNINYTLDAVLGQSKLMPQGSYAEEVHVSRVVMWRFFSTETRGGRIKILKDEIGD